MADEKFSTYLNKQGFDISKKSENKIKYQEYTIVVEGQEQTIYIPLRESVEFDTEISGIFDTISKETLTKILRKYRGIKEHK